MKIEFIGHACFRVTTKEGIKLLFDPYMAGAYGTLNLKPVQVDADVVLVSHQHQDHNFVASVLGTPAVIQSPGEHEYKNIRIFGYSTYHDESGGKERGENIVYKVTADDFEIIHFGDLGHPLETKDKDSIGHGHILLIPIGGFYTIDHKVAWDIIKLFKPNVVIPMHYKVKGVDFPIDTIDPFLQGKEKVKRVERSEIEVSSPEELPEPIEIWVLNPLRVP